MIVYRISFTDSKDDQRNDFYTDREVAERRRQELVDYYKDSTHPVGDVEEINAVLTRSGVLSMLRKQFGRL